MRIRREQSMNIKEQEDPSLWHDNRFDANMEDVTKKAAL
jgi:hypothetical protein